MREGAAVAERKTSSEFEDLGAFVETEMARLHVPGVAVGVIHEGEECTAGYGVTSVENPLSVNPDTLFMIGSTTKTVTATAAMRLVEAGKLDLDAPVRAYLPKLRLSDEAAAAGVTLRHLFNHTAGWAGDFFEDTGWGDDARTRVVRKMATLPQVTSLGTLASYNNAAFYLAGRLIEIVTRRTYEAAIKELVLDPLGMTSSFFFPQDVMTRRFAAGHIVKDGRPEVARPWGLHRSAAPAGGLCSTVKDQLTYARFQMGDGATADGARLLSPEMMAAMQTPATAAGSGFGMIGISWMMKDIEGIRTVRHGGSVNGQMSAFVMAPVRNFAVTVLTNADRGSELHGNTVQWTLQRYLGIVEPLPEPLDLPAERLAEYAGRYDAALGGGGVDLRLEGDRLMLAVIPGERAAEQGAPPPPPPVRLTVCAEDRTLLLDPPFKDSRGEFLRDADGSIAWLRFGGRLLARRRGGRQ